MTCTSRHCGAHAERVRMPLLYRTFRVFVSSLSCYRCTLCGRRQLVVK